MPNFGTSEYVLYKIALLQKKKQFWYVFMRHSRLFVLNFWWCILRSIVNIS